MTFSSLLFITALSLVNADGNITSYNLSNGPTYGEANPILAPVAQGYAHYLYTGAADGSLILLHDKLKAEHPGTEDIEAIGVIVAEYFSIRSWANRSDDIGFEVCLSEAEFLITSSVFNIQF